MFVSPARQGRGLGLALLTHLEDYARWVGLATLDLSASLPARDFYLHHGYHIDSEEAIPLPGGEKLRYYAMSKVLIDRTATMPSCPGCSADLQTFHTLISTAVSILANGSEIIEPSCGRCGRLIEVADVESTINAGQHVLLVSGTAGAGKSAVGQYIARHYPYLLIDGDAVSRQLNYRAKMGLAPAAREYLCHTEVIRTMLVTLGLGYHVVIAYVIELPDIARYADALAKYNVSYDIRILTPAREVCLERDRRRSGWTAGEEFIDKWFAGFYDMMQSHRELCIDTSEETVEETVAGHFHDLLHACSR